MRAGRALVASRSQARFIQFASTGIFAREHQADPRAADTEHLAEKLANQWNYNNHNYTYNGEAAPKFYGYEGYGYDGNALGYNTVINAGSYTPALYIIRDNLAATWEFQKWTYCESKAPYLPQPAGTLENLQSHFEAVPTPKEEFLLFGEKHLYPAGTDKEIAIYRPSTDEYWEVWLFQGSSGEYKFSNGGYLKGASKWSGVWYENGERNGWGSRACGLAAIGGTITMQDLVEVLRGGEIRHALGVALQVTTGPADNAAAHRAPATRNDTQNNIYKEFENYKKEKVTNPAYGTVDAVKEGSWFVLPSAARPSEYGITGKLASAIFEAIRKYGLFVNDSSGTVALSMEYTNVNGTPYSTNLVNPFVGAPNYTEYNEKMPASWTDSTLPHLEEELYGEHSVLAKQPVQDLELLETFAN